MEIILWILVIAVAAGAFLVARHGGAGANRVKGDGIWFGADYAAAQNQSLEFRGDDKWEMPARGLVEIVYEDVQGRRTRRVIDMRSLSGYRDSGNTDVVHLSLMIGFCRKRRDVRHFRVDRISSLVDMDTGEIFEGAAIRDYFAGVINAAL